MYKLSYPAINGETVTQGHADYCKANGCATHTVDGVVQDMCPRCGEIKDETVIIVIDTDRNGVTGRIDTMPQPRSEAIAALAESFGLSVNGWMLNTQSLVMGQTLATFTLVKA